MRLDVLPQETERLAIVILDLMHQEMEGQKQFSRAGGQGGVLYK